MHTDMPRVGFEPKIPVFERAKTVHALDRAATVIGYTVILHKFYILIYPPFLRNSVVCLGVPLLNRVAVW
jgi:hypothetical protein